MLSMLQGDPAALEVQGALPELQLWARPPLLRPPGGSTPDSAFARGPGLEPVRTKGGAAAIEDVPLRFRSSFAWPHGPGSCASPASMHFPCLPVGPSR